MVKTRIIAKVSLRNGVSLVCYVLCRRLTDSVVTWRQTLYNSAKEETSGVLVEEPSLPASPVAPRQNGQVSASRTRPPPVNNGAVRSGLRMMVSRMLGYA